MDGTACDQQLDERRDAPDSTEPAELAGRLAQRSDGAPRPGPAPGPRLGSDEQGRAARTGSIGTEADAPKVLGFGWAAALRSSIVPKLLGLCDAEDRDLLPPLLRAFSDTVMPLLPSGRCAGAGAGARRHFAAPAPLRPCVGFREPPGPPTAPEQLFLRA